MKKKLIKVFLAIIMIAIFAGTADRAIYAMTPKDVLKEIYQRQGLSDGAFELNLKFYSYQGKQANTAQIRVLFGDVHRQLVTFVEPARLRNNYYLVNNHNTWMYQQGLQRPIRISAQQKLFGDAGIAETVGIDYLNDYEIVSSTQHEQQCILELKARETGTAYQAATLTLNMEQRRVEQIVLKALNGQALKRLVYRDYHLEDGHEVAAIEIYNLFQSKNVKTVMEYTGIKSKVYAAEIFDPLMMGKIRI